MPEYSVYIRSRANQVLPIPDTKLINLVDPVTGQVTKTTAVEVKGVTLATVTALLALKSDVGHTHTIADISGLQAALDSKAPLVVSVPPGGQLGQVLRKNSNADYDFAWQTQGPPIGGITEFQFTVGDVGYPADGATTWTDAALAQTKLILHRNKVKQWKGDPGNGDSYYDKTLMGTTVTFSPALQAGEIIECIAILS